MSDLQEGGDTLLLHVVVPLLPPSSNHCYFPFHGRLVPTKEAKAFQRRYAEYVVGPNLPVITQIGLDKDKWVYSVWTIVYFDYADVINMTFGQKGGAISRYKQMDAENRLKLASDAFARAVGIDDKQFFRVIVDKANCAPGEPRIETRLYRVSPSNFGFFF